MWHIDYVTSIFVEGGTKDMARKMKRAGESRFEDATTEIPQSFYTEDAPRLGRATQANMLPSGRKGARRRNMHVHTIRSALCVINQCSTCRTE